MSPLRRLASVRPATARRAGFLAWAALATGCTVIPGPGFPASDEREVVVRYAWDEDGPHRVRVPGSDEQVTVLWLRTEPDARESFEAGRRFLSADGEALQVRCRYRVHAAAGGADLPGPARLFPAADSIRTLWQRRDRGPTETRNQIMGPPAGR